MKKITVVAVALALAALWFTGALAAGLEGRVREHTLKNGMKLLLVERHSSPTIAAWMRFRVGSVDERSDERGIAHLLEHMLFKGTRTIGCTDYAAEKPLLDRIEQTAVAIARERSRGEKADRGRLDELRRELADLEKEAGKYVVKEEFAQIYSRNGATGYNAMTGKDGTTYIINLPSNKLELWAAIESDRMRSPVLREFYTERAVVMEERRRTYDTDPEGKLWESFLAAEFVAHPYGQPIIGWMSDIENLTRSKAEGFLHRYYAPNNAIVALVGDFESQKAIALLERYFADIPTGDTVERVAVQEPEQPGERRVQVAADAEPQIMIGFHKPVYPDFDDYVFDVIDMILTDGRTSRLYRKLVQEKQLAADISSFTSPGHMYPNLFIVAASPRSPHTAQEVEQAVYEELERLKSEPVTQKELQQVLNRLEYEDVRQMVSNGGLARNLTEYEAIYGSWRYMIEHREKVAKVTPQDIMRVARTYLRKTNRTVATLVKEEVAK